MAIIGIDLGTTNSLVSYWKDGKVQLLRGNDGSNMFSSAAHFMKEGILVGNEARDKLYSDPKHTVASFKCFMGSDKTYTINGREYTPAILSSMVLKLLKDRVEAELGEEIEEAIITVPAYFNDRQRSDTKKAAQLAGLKVERLINEPSAAALYYMFQKYGNNIDEMEDLNLLVFDFGGGTLDLSYVECFENIVEIVAVAGNNHLGGDDIDQCILDYLCQEKGMTKSGSLLKEIRRAKENISTASVMEIHGISITEDELFEICLPLFQKIKEVVRMNKDVWDVLQLKAGVTKKEIRRQYAKFSRDCHPEEEPEKFAQLQNAYQMALELCEKPYGIEKFGEDLSNEAPLYEGQLAKEKKDESAFLNESESLQWEEIVWKLDANSCYENGVANATSSKILIRLCIYWLSHYNVPDHVVTYIYKRLHLDSIDSISCKEWYVPLKDCIEANYSQLECLDTERGKTKEMFVSKYMPFTSLTSDLIDDYRNGNAFDETTFTKKNEEFFASDIWKNYAKELVVINYLAENFNAATKRYETADTMFYTYYDPDQWYEESEDKLLEMLVRSRYFSRQEFGVDIDKRLQYILMYGYGIRKLQGAKNYDRYGFYESDGALNLLLYIDYLFCIGNGREYEGQQYACAFSGAKKASSLEEAKAAYMIPVPELIRTCDLEGKSEAEIWAAIFEGFVLNGRHDGLPVFIINAQCSQLC